MFVNVLFLYPSVIIDSNNFDSVFMGSLEVPSQSTDTIKVPTAHYEFGANFLDPKVCFHEIQYYGVVWQNGAFLNLFLLLCMKLLIANAYWKSDD